MVGVTSVVLVVHSLTFCHTGLVFETIKGKMLPNSQISKLSLIGIIRCMVICLSSERCKSVNYNEQFLECHLSNMTVVSSSSELNTAPDYDFIEITCLVKSSLSGYLEWRCKYVNKNLQCKRCHLSNRLVVSSYPKLNVDPDPDFTEITSPANNSLSGCMGYPDDVNGHFNNDPQKSPSGVKLPLVCDPGYIVHDEVVCQENGTWSSPMCVSVSSCSMVKEYQSTSGDGEYWLRLTNFDNYTTRIYCHNMSASSPEEFLTLQNVNYGIYPRIMNMLCFEQDNELLAGCVGQGGEIWFQKIKVNISTMKIFEQDRTFANISNKGNFLAYGTAVDCYTTHRNNHLRCGTRGRFIIDLRGTGWKIGEDQQWQKYRHMGLIQGIDRQENGTLIHLRCGGFPGGCKPYRGLFLKPNPS